MELKDRKLINNRAFPKLAGGLDPLELKANSIINNNINKGISNINAAKNARMSGMVNAGMGALGVIGDAVGYANDYKNSNEILADTKKNTSNVAGVSYELYGDIDESRYDVDITGNSLKSAATGATIGMALGPVGGVVGGVLGGAFGAVGSLIGSSKQKKQLELAKQKMNRENMFRFDNAFTEGQLIKYAQRYGNTEDQVLYAKNGKDVDTAFGVVDGKLNAWVNKGEFIFDTLTGAGHTVGRGPNDTAPAFLRGHDAVVTNKYGLADAAKSAYAQGDIEGVYNVLNAQKYMHMKGYKNGKDVPKFDDGVIPAWTNYVPNGIGAIASIGQYIDAASQDIHTPDIYAANPYSAEALRDMAGANYNAYPVAQALLRERAKTDRAIDASGGLSGALKYIGKIANAHNHYNTMANVWADFQKGNISLRQAYNQAKIAAGEQSAQRRQAANQFNEQYYAQAHAAKQLGKQMALRNVLDYMNNYGAMELKRRLANYMMGLYDELVAHDTGRARGNQSNKKNTTTYMPLTMPYKISGIKMVAPQVEPQFRQPSLIANTAPMSGLVTPWSRNYLNNSWADNITNKYGIR